MSDLISIHAQHGNVVEYSRWLNRAMGQAAEKSKLRADLSFQLALWTRDINPSEARPILLKIGDEFRDRPLIKIRVEYELIDTYPGSDLAAMTQADAQARTVLRWYAVPGIIPEAPIEKRDLDGWIVSAASRIVGRWEVAGRVSLTDRIEAIKKLMRDFFPYDFLRQEGESSIKRLNQQAAAQKSATAPSTGSARSGATPNIPNPHPGAVERALDTQPAYTDHSTPGSTAPPAQEEPKLNPPSDLTRYWMAAVALAAALTTGVLWWIRRRRK